MNLEEWRIGRVEPIKVHTLDKNNSAYELGVDRAGVSSHGQGDCMVQRAAQSCDICIHWHIREFTRSSGSNWRTV